MSTKSLETRMTLEELDNILVSLEEMGLPIKIKVRLYAQDTIYTITTYSKSYGCDCKDISLISASNKALNITTKSCNKHITWKGVIWVIEEECIENK